MASDLQTQNPSSAAQIGGAQGVDCLLVGHHEVDFDRFYRSALASSATSGAWHDLATNSVTLAGKRRTYTELLNAAIAAGTGRATDLDPFNMPHLGAHYLANFLAARGLSTDVINYVNADLERLYAALEAGAKCLAITTTYYVSDEPIRAIVKLVRSRAPDIPIIIGGPHIHAMLRSIQGEERRQRFLLSLGGDIYIVDSQGEATLARVVRELARGNRALDGIPNLYFRPNRDRRTRYSVTARLEEANDLNQNAIDWTRFSPGVPVPTAFMRTSRSCPFSCAFCNYPGFAGPHTLVDLDVIDREMTVLAERGVKNLLFVDDTFNVPLPRFKTLLRRMIAAQYKFRWTSFFRCSNADDEAFDLMAESGCAGVFLGIESGDQSVLEKMRKFAKVDRYRYGINGLTRRGIKTLASIIVGFPGESEHTVNNTIDFLQNSGTTYFTAQLYYHDTLAPIHQDRETYGIEGTGFSWSHSTMDWREAVAHKERLIRQVTKPLLLPLYGLSIWSLPYLEANGISEDAFHAFLRFGRDNMLAGLAQPSHDAIDALSPLGKNFAAGEARAAQHLQQLA